MKLRKKINISKSSLYLAVSYLGKLVKLGFTLNEDNYQKVAACLVLISAKMNWPQWIVFAIKLEPINTKGISGVISLVIH